MRRRRRRGGTWLPINPTIVADEAPGLTWFENQLSINSATPGIGDGSAIAVPITLDNTTSVETSEGTLRDFTEGQDYVLNRIVGKVWAGMEDETNCNVANAIVGMGFAVLPTEPGSNAPSASDPNEWNPLLARNAQEPWIWRRTWVLSNLTTANDNGAILWPKNTAEYGSLLDGGHVDTRSKRRITREHRLYWIAAFQVLDAGNPEGAANITNITVGYDIRLNGGMRRANNRSSF